MMSIRIGLSSSKEKALVQVGSDNRDVSLYNEQRQGVTFMIVKPELCKKIPFRVEKMPDFRFIGKIKSNMSAVSEVGWYVVCRTRGEVMKGLKSLDVI